MLLASPLRDCRELIREFVDVGLLLGVLYGHAVGFSILTNGFPQTTLFSLFLPCQTLKSSNT